MYEQTNGQTQFKLGVWDYNIPVTVNFRGIKYMRQNTIGLQIRSHLEV